MTELIAAIFDQAYYAYAILQMQNDVLFAKEF